MIYFGADDYGISKEYNRCIEECLDKGILNKVSVLPNGDIDDFVQKLSRENVLLTLHLNLVEGYPLSPPEEIDLLIDEKGCFKNSFIGLFLKSFSWKRKKYEKQIYTEIRNQIRFWIEKTGDASIAIDCHQHAYEIPWVFKTMAQVIRDEKLDVKYLRIPAERLRAYLFTPSLYTSYSLTGLIKQLLLKILAFINRRSLKGFSFRSAYFMGVMLSGKLNPQRVEKLLKYYLHDSKQNKRDIEVAFHPGCIQEELELIEGSREDFRKFYSSSWRDVEYKALMDQELNDLAKEGKKMPYLEKEKVDEKTREKLEALIEKSYFGYWKKKRLFDIFFATLILLGFLPLMVIIAIVIVIDDPSAGPFFKQKRVGRHGEEFYMYKFRTMRPNAEQLLEQLKDKNELEGPVFKIKNDPRITRVGKILRKLSLDELMQFFNVLKGDMTLVGPRPPLPREVEYYTDYQKLRLHVTPGITCTWQISKNRNDIPFEEWVEMDLDYIQNRTFPGDILIMLKTPIVMLSATGR